MGELPCYMGTVPEYEVTDDGQMLVTLDGFSLIMPIHIFLQGCARGKAAIEMSITRPTADILPFVQEYRGP